MFPSRILVPTDGSENSKRAVSFAIALAEKLNASIVFLNVVEIPVTAYRYHPVAEGLLEVLEEGGRSLLAESEEEAKSRHVPCEIVLAHGDPAGRILSTIKTKKCDSVVLGKRGTGRIARLLLGSVSDQVSRLAGVPVIIVK
ncbi:MAG TPA: universal stress protein [Nitrososphaerales archaeon]|nr:universal stress protein [Nitrososphaerales archaeon]